MRKKLKILAEISVPKVSFIDWPRFWGKYTEATDKSSIAPISKLTNLLELLKPKVKRSVGSLALHRRRLLSRESHSRRQVWQTV